ncbi:c-type cytochrome [Rhizobium leguminosarum]|nr:c-type cytochrome [Rhizobium ruizarguesonis]NEK30497.1 c-type cytochrome [Rhizobium ruizarguesonis]
MARHWRRLTALAAAVIVVGLGGAAVFFFWPHSLPQVAASASQPHGQALIEKGKYLTIAADCEACHTAPGGKTFAGGLPFKLPFGTMYSPNITPDTETGIGGWSDAEFVRAMRSGVGKHGEDLYPAFPYTSYSLLSTDDILAIKAYLGSQPPVKSLPPENELLFPFSQRYVIRGWKLLFVPWDQFNPDPGKSAAWNQGAYLVEALGHCGECHTPRGLLFQREQGKALSGGAVDGWNAWNITPDKGSGIGNWSNEDLATYLAKGYAKGHGPAAGPMRQAIELSLSKLHRSDIDAIVTYLKDVPPRPAAYESSPVTVLAAAAAASQAWAPGQSTEGQGERIFEGACASCHGWDGSGQNIARASLSGSHSVNDPTAANLVRVILQGTNDGKGTVATAMPGFADAYSDTEIAALANCVREHFGGHKGDVTPDDVANARN